VCSLTDTGDHEHEMRVPARKLKNTVAAKDAIFDGFQTLQRYGTRVHFMLPSTFRSPSSASQLPVSYANKPLSRISKTPAPTLKAGTVNNKKQIRSQDRRELSRSFFHCDRTQQREPNSFTECGHPRQTLKLQIVAKLFFQRCNHFADLLATTPQSRDNESSTLSAETAI
jgi:hypothetical protein